MIVETTFIHESGETFSAGKLHVPASKHDAQGYGSALTYARRYSLMAACGIAPEDDDGNAATSAPPASRRVVAMPPPTPKAGANEIASITKLANATGTELSAIASAYGLASINDLPMTKVAEVIARLQKKATVETTKE